MDKYKIIAILLALSAIFSAGSWWGYSGEHDLRVADKAAADALASNQAAQIKTLVAERKVITDEGEHNAKVAAESISNWYRDHPVIRVLHTTDSNCTVSTTTTDTSITDGTAAILYVSPHDPEQVELVASRLDQLQKLLIDLGVKIIHRVEVAPQSSQ